jgi:hypothetical protein
MPLLKVNQIASYSGNTLTIGTTGDTINVASGVTFNTASATVNYPAGSITNAAINASAAIAYSKLNLSNSIVNADIASNAAIATTKLGAGAVLQVVSGSTTTEINMNSSTFISTGLSTSITPTSSTNKILIFVNQTGLRKENDVYMRLKLQRGTTDISNIDFDGGYTGTSAVNSFGGTGICFLDTPTTTSSTSYRTVFNSPLNANLVYVNISGSRSTMVLMEIAG